MSTGQNPGDGASAPPHFFAGNPMSMTKNTNPWCKMMYRDWLESERIMDMSLAAEGLYHRCLMVQAARGSIPADLQKLSRLLQKDKHEVEAVWPQIAPHFRSETVGGEERLYNEKQRDLLREAESKQASYSNGSKKAWKNRRSDDQDDSQTESITDQDETELKPLSDQDTLENERTQNRALRASVSASVSKSASVSDLEKKDARPGAAAGEPPGTDKDKARKLEQARAAQAFEDVFWPSWPAPRKNKQEARDAWIKLCPGPELQAQIIKALDRQKQSDQWMRGIVPHASTWLRKSRWLDEDDGSSSGAAPNPPEPVPDLPPLELLPQDDWRNVLHDFALGDPEVYEAWIAPLKPLGHADGTVYIAAPSDIVRNWVAANHRDQIELLLGCKARIITKEDFL